MKYGIAFVTVLMLCPLSSPVMAQVDCEAARCSVQADIDTACPCDSPEFTNHGSYVSCVARVVRQLARDGKIPGSCRGRIKRCFARSICGRAGAVICVMQQPGVCDTSSNTCRVGASSTGSCSSDAECSKTKCRPAASAEQCSDSGGAVTAGSSCCASCP